VPCGDLLMIQYGFQKAIGTGLDHSTVPLQCHPPEDEVGIQQVYANALALKWV
jgi:hypothetical protein